MSADLELDFVSLQSEMEKLDKAIKRFEPYSKGFIDSTLQTFEGFNSDFISKMEDLLNDMRDTEAPKLVKELNEFSTAIKQAVEAFQSQDAQYAKSMGGENDGK